MPLGTYRLQDPNGVELQALVHGNRLDQLRRQTQNENLELVPSDPENTQALERYLREDPEDEDLEPLPMDTLQDQNGRSLKRTAEEAELPESTRTTIKIPLRRWRDQIALRGVEQVDIDDEA